MAEYLQVLLAELTSPARRNASSIPFSDKLNPIQEGQGRAVYIIQSIKVNVSYLNQIGHPSWVDLDK